MEQDLPDVTVITGQHNTTARRHRLSNTTWSVHPHSPLFSLHRLFCFAQTSVSSSPGLVGPGGTWDFPCIRFLGPRRLIAHACIQTQHPSSTLPRRPCRSPNFFPRSSLCPLPKPGGQLPWLLLGINANVLSIAYATHLANLVPLNVSTHRPHASVIQGFLTRAGLPDDIVAFAACILDGLSSRFAGTWRHSLATRLSPDVIVLASLSLAHGFLVDRMRSSRHWSIKESNGAFSVQQIEATMRAILHDMDYGLSRISNDMVQRRLKNMQPSNPSPVLSATQPETVGKEPRRRNMAIVLQGAAIWQHGVQTPEPSP